MKNRKSFVERIYEALEIEDDKTNVGDIVITLDMKEYHELMHFFQGYSIKRYIDILIKKIQKKVGSVLNDEDKNKLTRKVVRKIFIDILTSNDKWDKEFKILYDRTKNKIKIPLLLDENENKSDELEIINYFQKEEFIDSVISDINENYMAYIEEFYEKLLKRGLVFLPQDQQYLSRLNSVLDKYLEMMESKKQAM